MCTSNDGKPCSGKVCGELRNLPGERSRKIKEDLFKYEDRKSVV